MYPKYGSIQASYVHVWSTRVDAEKLVCQSGLHNDSAVPPSEGPHLIDAVLDKAAAQQLLSLVHFKLELAKSQLTSLSKKPAMYAGLALRWSI